MQTIVAAYRQPGTAALEPCFWACPDREMAQTVPDRPPLSSCKGVVAPELAYVTARSAALVLFGKIATLLSDLLPVSGAQNAGTVRNRTLRVGQEVVPQRPIDPARPPTAPP